MVILVAELLAIVLTLAQIPWNINHLYSLATYSLFIQWIALSCAGVLCLLRRHITQLPEHVVATVSYLITVIITLIISEIAWHQLAAQRPEDQISTFGHGLFLLKTTGISAIVSALALRYFYVQHQWRMQLETEAEARFQALQSRIRPHFLFNCMNTIAGLIRRQPGQAEQAVHDLADLFRASLGDVSELTTLDEELRICEQYLRIEQLRLGERLRVNWQIPDRYHQVRLPVLCLQPLLENSIYHGVEPRAAGGEIAITCREEGTDLAIRISNPLPETRTGDRRHSGNRIAQENISGRLAALYGRDDLLSIIEEPDSYQVVLTIPMHHENSDR